MIIIIIYYFVQKRFLSVGIFSFCFFFSFFFFLSQCPLSCNVKRFLLRDRRFGTPKQINYYLFQLVFFFIFSFAVFVPHPPLLPFLPSFPPPSCLGLLTYPAKLENLPSIKLEGAWGIPAFLNYPCPKPFESLYDFNNESHPPLVKRKEEKN